MFPNEGTVECHCYRAEHQANNDPGPEIGLLCFILGHRQRTTYPAFRELEKAVRHIQEMGTLEVRAHPCSGEIRVTSRKFRVTAREVLQEK